VQTTTGKIDLIFLFTFCPFFSSQEDKIGVDSNPAADRVEFFKNFRLFISAISQYFDIG
jgi:hypothetical protein